MTTTESIVKLNPSGALLHRQLFVMLREQITSGALRPNEQLPTQEALCRRYEVSRITVRRALLDLQNEGFVRNVQGVGSFVAARAQVTRVIPTGGFLQELSRSYEETKMTVLSIEKQRCPLYAASALQIEDGDDALHIVRTRAMKSVPVMLLDAWIPSRCSSAVTARTLARKPLYELVSGGSENLGKVVQEMNAALADPIVAKTLQVEINAPVLRIDRLMHDRDQRPIALVTIFSSPTRSRFVMEIPADDLNEIGAGRLLHSVG